MVEKEQEIGQNEERYSRPKGQYVKRQGSKEKMARV